MPTWKNEMTVSRVIAAAILAVVITLPSVATGGTEDSEQTAKPKTNRVEAIGHWAYGRLDRAHDALRDEKFEKALEELDEMKRSKHLNAHERAMMWQTYGYVQSSQGEHERAVESFEQCLAQNGLPERSQLATRSNIAQIYLMLGDYDKAIESFELWLSQAENPGPESHYMIALAYAHADDVDKAMRHAEAAVGKSTVPHEGRLQLLTALYFRRERYAELLPLLEQLAANFPKKSYWLQLSAIHAELGNYKQALGVQEAAYEQQYLSEHREYVTLARFFVHNDVPYEAAKVLESGIEEGVVEPSAEAWDLLGSSYLQAREYDKALAPLARAAELSTDGKAYVRLGEVYLTRSQWREARQALATAVARGGLDDEGRAYLLLGIANVNESRFDDAKQAFATARGFEESAQSAEQWLVHVQREIELAQQDVEQGHSASTQDVNGTDPGAS